MSKSKSTQPPKQEITILTLAQVMAKVKKSRSFFYVAMDKNHSRHDATFPTPIKLGKRAIGFLESEIDAWLQAKIDAREI